MTPFIHRVPKDPVGNLRWRIKVRRLAAKDRELQGALYDAAMQDVLFFFNAFLWIEEPRASLKEVPFVTWPHQDPVILKIDETMQRTQETGETIDVLVPKSREQGGTYLVAGVMARLWLRDRKYYGGMVTRNEADVDSKTNAGALMYKVVYLLKMLPWWMLPAGFDFEKHRNLTEHVLSNPRTEGTIRGSAAVSDLFRGDRLSTLFFDEAGSKEWIAGGKDYEAAASTAHVTHCRVFVSTFGADSGMFYRACQDLPENGILLKLDWRDNPVHSRLAFTLREGVATARTPADQGRVEVYHRENRPNIESLVRRGFIKEGKLVSPWYIGHCLRPGSTPRSIAREIDMDARGAVGKVFDPDVLDRMLREQVRPPVWQGRLTYDRHTMQPEGLLRQEGGPLKLWFKPRLEDQPPPGRYCLGFDIATGRNTAETSNSAIVGADLSTGEQVLEYASRAITAIEFARLGVALARWLNGAVMNWDAGGPTGGAFREEVLERIGYYRVFYRPKQPEFLWKGESSEKAGSFIQTDEQKGLLFETMSMEMADGTFVPRSEEFIRECGEYEWGPGGAVIHRPAKDKKEEGKAHGDLVIAGGCCLIGIKDLATDPLDKTEKPAQIAKYGTLAWRIEREEADRTRLRDTEGEGLSLRSLLLGAGAE